MNRLNLSEINPYQSTHFCNDHLYHLETSKFAKALIAVAFLALCISPVIISREEISNSETLSKDIKSKPILENSNRRVINEPRLREAERDERMMNTTFMIPKDIKDQVATILQRADEINRMNLSWMLGGRASAQTNNTIIR